MLACHCCGAAGLDFLWTAKDGGRWYRCPACCCDSQDAVFDPTLYGPDYPAKVVRHSRDIRRCAFRTEAAWFNRYAAPGLPRYFLDVGHLDGAMMDVMREFGWFTHGFEIGPTKCLASHTTVAPEFRHDLFPMRYGAVFAGDVIEHVPDWRRFLAELSAAARPRGLVQIATPRPTATRDAAADNDHYCREHLQLFAPAFLRSQFGSVGLSVLESRFAGIKQAWLLRKTEDVP